MASDISNNTVAILLLVVIAISAIGTYSVMTSSPQQVDDIAPDGAQVHLAIASPPPEASVQLTIVEAETETEETQ